MRYFSGLGLQCPPLFHPGDYFLDIISLDNRSADQEVKSRKRIQFILESFSAVDDAQSVESGQSQNVDSSKSLAAASGGVTSGVWEQFEILSTRNVRQIVRDRSALGIRIFTACFFALFLSALYSDMGSEQKDIQNRNGILFFIAINQSFGGMVATLNVFIGEKVQCDSSLFVP